jgi:hypothetical protein
MTAFRLARPAVVSMAGAMSTNAAIEVGDPFTATLAITSPVQYRTFQRSPTTADIAITGTHSGIVSGGIEASFNGGAYQTIVASPTGSTFSGTLTAQAVGQGTLRVRCVNAPGSSATKANISVGDIYIVIGDSNHSGRATTSTVQPSPQGGITAIEYTADGVWRPLQENTTYTGAFDDPAGALYATGSTSAAGSYFGALSNLMLANNGGIPVAFVPCAMGSTTLDEWSITSNGTNIFWLYGRALSRARDIGYTHKAALCLLGTNVGSLDEAGSISAYNTLINSWFADTGAPTVLYYAVNATTANNNAVASVLSSNSHAKAGPTFVGAWTGVHYLTAAEINVAAGRAWTALQALFY